MDRFRTSLTLAIAILVAVTVFVRSPRSGPSDVAAQGATPTPLPDLILDARRQQLGGEHEFGRVILRNRARLEIMPYAGSENTGRLVLGASYIEIDTSSSILGTAAGYRGVQRSNGEGPGGGEGGARTVDGAGGGAYGGDGGDGVLDNQAVPGAKGGRAYGTSCGTDIDRGSAGGAPGTADSPRDTGAGGSGGAALTLIAPTVLISGTIELDGEDGTVVANDAGGGGAGGGLLVQAEHLSQTGTIEALGGKGADTDDGGGGGGGGRIKLFYVDGVVTRRTLRVDGGKGDGNGYPNDGKRGTTCIEVIVPTPTDTPTPGPTPTATFTPSPTATPTEPSTPTSTPSPTPTATPTPAALYLPLALREECRVEERPVAVALVIDASTTMNGATRTGRTKIAAALDAARVPIGLLGLPGTAHNEVALVVFNDTARVAAPLTDDKIALGAALDGVVTSPGSRIDEGVRLGAAALESAPPGATRRLVVLTDGLPDPSTPADALAAAEDARAAGIVVDTIGLGEDVDAALLTNMAGDAARYHPAPDAEDLTDLFADLGFVPPPCGGVITWPGRK